MQFLKKFFLAAAISTTAVSAQAGAVFGDWKVSGDNNAILHEEAGIEWLRLNETDGMSVNYVLSQTGAGGEFAGWRMPTADEVSTFIGSFYPDYDTSQEYRRYSSQGYDDRFWPEHRRYRDVILTKKERVYVAFNEDKKDGRAGGPVFRGDECTGEFSVIRHG